MSVKHSATALTLRCTMIVMACLFLLLAYWKIPALGLDARGLLIGWLLVLVTAGQCAVAAVMARRVTGEQAATSPLVMSQFIGLFIFIGVIFLASRLETITPPQLNLMLMLGINAVTAATLAGILLTPQSEEETNHA
jgi:hypothetical protein